MMNNLYEQISEIVTAAKHQGTHINVILDNHDNWNVVAFKNVEEGPYKRIYARREVGSAKDPDFGQYILAAVQLAFAEIEDEMAEWIADQPAV